MSNLESILRQRPKSSAPTSYSPSAATRQIDSNLTRRDFASHKTLDLLGLEEEFSSRIAWLASLQRAVPDLDKRSLAAVRAELQHTSRQPELISTARVEFARRNKWLSLYPDEGPFRRELYSKHLEFFRNSSVFNELLMLGSNRCLSPWSAIETGRATRQIAELIAYSNFDVQSWDGSSRCSKKASSVFLKGIEPMFRIHLDNGSTFDATRRHRVLTVSESDGHRREKWLTVDQLIRASSGLHCRRIESNSSASYVEDGHRRDPQLLSQVGIALQKFPSQAGAQKHILRDLLVDGVEPTRIYSRACRDVYRRSNHDAQTLLADLCDQWIDPSSLIDGAYFQSQTRGLLEFRNEYIQLRRTPGFSDRFQPIRLPFFGGTSVQFVRNDSEENSYQRRLSQQFPSDLGQHISAEEFLDAEAYTSLLLSLDSPQLVGGGRIDYIIPIGLQPVLDFEVEGTHNYELGGVIHHNSGKTLACSYAVTCHTTGIYPLWWEGRRFTEPMHCWIVNKGAKDCRDINEQELLGPSGNLEMRGTGMIPAHRIIKCTPKSGTPNAVEFIDIMHVSGGQSRIQSKSFDQGREAFQGTATPLIWLDEECPDDVYGECLMRTLTCEGLVLVSYTPIQGLTPLTTEFLRAAGIEIEGQPLKPVEKVS